MEVEKRSSKGGFLQLFDWNVKSRKKLFSNKSELPDSSHQGKEIFDNTDTALLQQIKLHENGSGPGFKGSSVYSCAPLVSHNEGLGTKAPGVVARLMGLDSMPTSNQNCSPSFTACFDSRSFRDSHPFWVNTGSLSEHHIIEYGNVRNKSDGFSMNPVEIRLPKLQSHPIERFQTEILPPKSAKPIPVTHHRLLSPIKSPGFISTRNPAYVMEAAAKIIEQSPQSTTKVKLPSFASSSVPLKIRDLKEKMEATQRASRLPETSQGTKEHYSVKNMGGNLVDKSRTASESTQLSRAPVVSRKVSPESSKHKGKSVSLAVQAKLNVQRREGLASSGSTSSAIQKINNVFGSGNFDKNQISTHNKTSSRRALDALRQNNQKQNCPTNKDGINLKSSVSHKQEKRAQSLNVSYRSKTLNKGVVNSSVGSRRVNLVAADAIKELSSSKARNAPGKKLNVIGEVHYDGGVVIKVPVSKNERSEKSNVSTDGCTNWDAVDRKNGTDVVSFTFTSPIKKSAPDLQSFDQDMEKNSSSVVNCFNDGPDPKRSTVSSVGMNVIGSDALSVLLEKKLNELACRVESSRCNMFEARPTSCSGSSLLESSSSLDEVIALPTEHIKSSQLGPSKDKPDSQCQVDHSLVEGLLLKAKQKLQEVEEGKELGSKSKCGLELVCQPSPVSSLEPSFSDESCNSLEESITSFSSNGNEQFFLADAREMLFSSSNSKHPPVEVETELSDSASSVFVGSMDRKDTSDSAILPYWDLEYVQSIIGNVDSMLNGLALSQNHKVIMPDQFDQLENKKSGWFNSIMSEDCKLERKLLFDCVSECLEFRCKRLLGGGCKAWARWMTQFRQKEWLAEELYKEISGWIRMEELMVDEVVDRDMSTQCGKWVDFEIETFEEGIEMEKEILTSLIDELVADISF